jgi:hypothetical protein
MGRVGIYRLAKMFKADIVEFEVPHDCSLEPYLEERSEGWSEGGGMHGTDQDIELAQAIAFLKAKELAMLFGYIVPYGWPVWWGESKVLVYEPNGAGKLYIDSKENRRSGLGREPPSDSAPNIMAPDMRLLDSIAG